MTDSFFRRPLPSPPATDLTSAEGRAVFASALSAGTAVAFFKLMAQFRTQDEPAYCALGSLVTVLNALAVDPGRQWKGPWRWWHESMLECCEPLEVIRERGLVFDKAVCVARCNGASVEPFGGSSAPGSLEEFRARCVAVCGSDDAAIVVSYYRPAFGQTGGGHFSPLGAYDAASDSVLILDVARFKYPPHWVPLPLMWEAMRHKDEESGQPRGHMVLRHGGDSARETFVFSLARASTVERDVLVNQLRTQFCPCPSASGGGVGLASATTADEVLDALMQSVEHAERLVTTYEEEFGSCQRVPSSSSSCSGGGCSSGGGGGACSGGCGGSCSTGECRGCPTEPGPLLREVGELPLTALVRRVAPGAARPERVALMVLAVPVNAWRVLPEQGARRAMLELVNSEGMSEALQAEIRVMRAQMDALISCACGPLPGPPGLEGWAIRAVEARDVPRLQELVRAVLAEHGLPGSVGQIAADMQDLVESYSAPRCGCWVLVGADDEALGCAAVRPVQGGAETDFELKRFYVFAAQRGRGFGRALLEHAEGFAREQGGTAMHLESSRRFARAKAFYQRAGYRVVESLDNDWEDDVYVRSL